MTEVHTGKWDCCFECRTALWKPKPDSPSSPLPSAEPLLVDLAHKLHGTIPERMKVIEAAYRAGMEAAAKVAEQPRILDAMAGIVAVPDFGREIAAAIREKANDR